MQRAMAAGISEKSELEAELIRLRDQLRSRGGSQSRNLMVLQSRISEMEGRIADDKRELEYSTEKVLLLNNLDIFYTGGWSLWRLFSYNMPYIELFLNFQTF